MKKNIILILSLIVIICSSGCEDYLDQPVLAYQTLDNFYTTPSECEQAIMACYQSLSPEDWWEMDFFWLIGDVCSDDAFKGNSIVGDQAPFGDLARWNIDPYNEWLETKWKYTYITVSRANLIIEHVADAEIEQALKDQIIAEAKFLRAWAYFEIVKNFGGAVLVDKQPEPNDVFPRSTIEETWEFIESDLIEASLVLPEKKDQDATDYGRVTKGAALAYLAKASLYQNKFQEARDYAFEVMQLNDYGLENNFEDIWSVNNPNGTESIFEIQHNYDPALWTGNALPVLTRSRADGGWGFGTPSSHLHNFMQGDPRLEHTIILHGDSVDSEHPSYDTQLDQNESGRINRKFYLGMADRVADDEYIKAPLNYIMFRYADLLLMYAEASYYSSESDALNALNEVRTKRGIAQLNLSGSALLNAIYNERRMELALEGHRFYDLKRTGQLEDAIVNFVQYNTVTSIDLYDAGNPQGTLFDASKHYLFPIPQTEIDLSEGVIEQNPFY